MDHVNISIIIRVHFRFDLSCSISLIHSRNHSPFRISAQHYIVDGFFIIPFCTIFLTNTKRNKFPEQKYRCGHTKPHRCTILPFHNRRQNIFQILQSESSTHYHSISTVNNYLPLSFSSHSTTLSDVLYS